MTSAKNYTRSGVRRAGDDYQDVVALDVLVSMLEHLDRYQWVSVEADDSGYLDDVVALRQDGTLEATQVKFSAHPEEANDPYDWDKLTATRKGKDGAELPSLISKWGTTVLRLLAEHVKIHACLVTNRRAAPDLARCIDNATDRVRPERVPREVMTELKSQLGGKKSAVLFLANFEFRFDCLGLEAWEPRVHKRFSSLGGEYVGWLDLKENLRRWVCEKTLPVSDGRIRLADVQRAARWHRLEALPQGFDVPADYVLPSKPLHEDVLHRLSLQTGACLVISGTPGIGKSTYLSYLYRDLQHLKRPVVRHHYFLSLCDTTVGRFEHARVVESLMADLRLVADEPLRAFDGRNPAPGDFPKWLNACGAYYAGQAFPLVIVVDGLDHVWRERREADELTRLFESLLPVRPGVCIVVGTQPLADDIFPKRLLDAAPRDRWVGLPPLDRQAVFEWTQRNEDRLEFRRNARPGDRKGELAEIASAFFEASQGQPLLLRYGMNALVEAGQSVNACSILSRCRSVGGSISDYYRSLWNGLGRDGRFMLSMIASAGFEWPTGGLAACCARGGIGPFDAERAWQQVVHMMCRVPLGWRPFHSSLGAFVAETEEYGAVVQQVRPAVSAWLRNDAPDYWRWAYAWATQADAGDPAPLLAGTTREWIVDSLARGYPHSQVGTLLERAATQALAQGDLRSFAHRALLFEYVSDSYNLTNWGSRDDWTYAQLVFPMVDRLPDVLFARRMELTDQQLAVLGQALCLRGDGRGVATLVAELIDRLNTRWRTEPTHDWISQVTPIIWTESLVDGLDVSGIAERIRKNRNNADSVRFSAAYAQAFRASQRVDPLRQMCDADLGDSEREQFLKQGFFLALEEGADWSDVARRHRKSVFPAIYARIKRLSRFAVPALPLPSVEIVSKRGHEVYGQEKTVAMWMGDCFYRIFAHVLCRTDRVVEKWLSEMGNHTWQRTFVQQLAVAARELADAVVARQRYTLADFYEVFAGLPRPEFNARDGAYEFWQIARQVLTDLGLEAVLIAADSPPPSLERKDAERTVASQHCYWADWMREYVQRRRAWLSPDAVDWIVGKYGDLSGASIKDLAGEGVSEATMLANLLALHGRRDQAFDFLRRAVDLTLTHGYHKDILLDDYLDAVTRVGQRSPDFAARELAPVIPAILHLHDFTDGDETRHIPGRLFDLLATLRSAWLASIYHYLCQHEEYRDAEDAFRRLVRALAFDSPGEIAVGSTCLDEESLAEISDRADAGVKGATQALAAVRQMLGTSPFPPKKPHEEYSSTPSSTERSVPPNVDAYPPDRILDYWRDLRAATYTRGTNELREWASFWEKRNGLHSVRDALIVSHETSEGADCAGTIYDLTVRLEGRSAAWPWLVKAHHEVHGWSSHWTDANLAREKWELVARYHPEKWLKFIAETMAPGRWSWEGIGVWGRLTRLVPYLLLLNRGKEAEAVVQGVREAIEGLVTPFGLKPAAWLEDGKSRDGRLLDILLARLTWPSGMVRERACNALAALLAGGPDAERVGAALVAWVQKQDLESVACLGLLPFIRAKQLNPQVSTPAADCLRNACSRPSLLYEILLEELVPSAGRELPAGVGHAGAVPRGFEPPPKFTEHYDHSLPTMYREQAALLERKFGVPFQGQWAYEVKHTGDGLRTAHVTSDFWGQLDGEHYVAFDCPLSECLRSGYLRALAWLAEQGDAQRFWAMGEALRTLPIDLGLWKVSPHARPDWWPLRQSSENTDLDTTPVSALRDLEAFLSQQQDADWLLGMASGRMADGGAVYDLDVFGVFQKCLGPEEPKAEAVWHSETWRRETVLLEPISPRFSGTPIDVGVERAPVRLRDWLLLPCVLAGHPHMAARWQWWRLLRGIWLPLPALAKDGCYRVDCQADRIGFRDGDGQFGFWQDWTAGLSEMQDANLMPRSGQVLMLRRYAVERLAAEKGWTFCWACRIRGFQRKHAVGHYDEFSLCRVLGASNLVLPA